MHVIKKLFIEFFQQIIKLKNLILISSIVALTPVILANIIHHKLNINFGQMTRDIVTLADMPLYTGFMSQLTILVWASSVAICFFCLFLKKSDPVGKSFFEKAFLITTILCFDDTFLLHDIIAPHFGVSEHVIYLGYVLLIILFLIFFFEFILTTNYSLLIIALSLFAVSVLIDIFNGFGLDEYITEDGTKLAGAVFWFVYFMNTGLMKTQSKNR